MTAILAITATPYALQVVVRDIAVRLWIRLDYRRRPGARSLVDRRPVTTDPPRDAPDAVHLVANLVRTPGIRVTAVALLVKLDDGAAFAPAFATIDAARMAWPDVPCMAWFGTQPDDEIGALLRGSDERAERILDFPRGHFARARARVRADLTEAINGSSGMHRQPWAAS
jgi:hypothetical protein